LAGGKIMNQARQEYPNTQIPKYPCISIVTPCFNGGKYLETTIESVLQQNYPNLEYIIIDGGSTDNSLEIIKKYESHLTYWISEKDNGMYEAVQKGFMKSTGEIMAWLNSDDIYYSKAFFVMSEIFSKYTDIQWVQGAGSHLDEQGRTVSVQRNRNFARCDFLYGDYKWVQQESCFWRRTLWEQSGGSLNCALRYAGDFELWLRFSRFAKMYVTDALIGGFRLRKGQLSLNMNKYMAEVTDIIKNEPISKEDRRMLKQYKAVRACLNIMEKMRIFDTNDLLRKYHRLRHNNGGCLAFDRYKQKFVLE
jgi:glycosyltransferase involved in cell wall biosynthesis